MHASSRHHNVRVRSLAFAIALTLAISAHAEPTLRVLFIGNSLTYSNDLPGVFRRIAAADGRRVRTEMIARPNYSIGDHLDDGAKKILQQQWDYIVLQQGPSAMEESRRSLLFDVKAVAALIRPPARIAVLMSWPPRARWHDLQRVADSHRLAAEAVNGVFIPGGTALQQALDRDPGAALFTADGFHPSPAGTRVVAQAIYEALQTKPPETPCP